MPQAKKAIPSSFKDVSTHSRATSGGTSIFHASSVNNRDDGDDSQISAYKVQLQQIEKDIAEEESYDFEANLKE